MLRVNNCAYMLRVNNVTANSCIALDVCGGRGLKEGGKLGNTFPYLFTFHEFLLCLVEIKIHI